MRGVLRVGERRNERETKKKKQKRGKKTKPMRVETANFFSLNFIRRMGTE